MAEDLARLAQHATTLNAERGADAATPESAVQDGAEQAASTTGKVFLGANPSLKDRGVLPWESNVGGGLSLTHLSPLKDVAGGIVASLGKYFTLAWDWLLGKSESGGDTSTGDANGGASGNTGEATGAREMAAVRAEDMPEVIEYGGKLMASDPIDVPLEKLGQLVPSETPSIGREGPQEGVAL